MERALRSLNWKYPIFIVSIATLIIANTSIVYYFQEQQEYDAAMVNRAGKMRMLSQRLTKYAAVLSMEHDKRASSIAAGDSIAALIGRLQASHRVLVEQCRKYGYAHLVNNLEELQPDIDSLQRFSKDIVATNDGNIKEAVFYGLLSADEVFLPKMDALVTSLQVSIEQKVNNVKIIGIVLSISAIALLIFEFMYFFRPTISRINTISLNLIESNRNLATSEEELRSSLDQFRHLKKTIEESEKHYRKIVEEATDAIYELNEKGELLFFNEVLVRITGFERGQLMGKPFVQLLHPDDREPMTDYYRNEIRSGREIQYQEFRFLTASQKIVWIGQNIKLNFNDEGKLVGISGLARDITSLKTVRDQLATSESLYRLLSDNVTDVVTLIGEDRKLRFISKSCKEVLGYDSSELVGKSMISLIPEDEQQAIINAGNDLRSKGISMPSFQFNLYRKDGVMITVEAQSKLLVSESGERLVQASFRDISARKLAEQKLKESERLYKLLSENMQDLVTLTTIDARFSYVSPSVRSMLGYEPGELIGTLTYDLLHPADRPDPRNRFSERLQNLAGNVSRLRIRKKDGSYIWIESLTFPIKDREGNVSLIQTTSRDVSERIKFEQQLLEASKRAESATSAKSQFLSMMSHEIRTPMNAVLNLTNLLLDKETDPNKKDKLQLMKISEDHLLTIINDILDFTKIEADKITIEEVNFNLKNLAGDVVKLTQHQAQQKGLEIKYEYDSELPAYFSADPVRIGQILTNLLNNSVKFTHQGSIRLSVRKQFDEAEYVTLMLEVTDTGIGIPEDKTASIFESFTQAENGTTRMYGGTGLGLAITQKLVKLMGGDIGVQSKAGVGSRFFVQLRLKKGFDTASSNRAVSLTDNELIGKKILLVEDNMLNQLVAREYLEQWGFFVVNVMNGQDAVKIVADTEFDLILLDLQMPGMSGYETCRAIRAMEGERFKNVPIIALTASATTDVKAKAVSAGMNDYVSKPFDPQRLREMIARHLGGGRATYRTKLLEDFEKHSFGKRDLKERLVRSAIENMEEIKEVFEKTKNGDGEPGAFSRTAHKVKMSISFLNDDKLTEVVRRANEIIKSGNLNDLTDQFTDEFHRTLDTILSDLKAIL